MIVRVGYPLNTLKGLNGFVYPHCPPFLFKRLNSLQPGKFLFKRFQN